MNRLYSRVTRVKFIINLTGRMYHLLLRRQRLWMGARAASKESTTEGILLMRSSQLKTNIPIIKIKWLGRVWNIAPFFVFIIKCNN